MAFFKRLIIGLFYPTLNGLFHPTPTSLVGYQDYAYFTRVFKKETGVSPKQYRK